MPDRMPDIMSEDVSDRMPDTMSQYVPDRIYVRLIARYNATMYVR